MSLATRCTACGTIFRIVEDQLRVSDGWVRCGRCAEVFDARELLFDIERDPPPAWPVQFTSSAPAVMPAPLPPPPPPPPPPAPPPAPIPEPAPPSFSAQDPEPGFDATVEMPLGPEYDPTVQMPLDDLAGGRHEPRWVDAPAASNPPTPPAPVPATRFPEPLPEPATASVPEFVRRAQADERWKRPGVRLALGLMSVALLAALAGQVSLHFRDALGALFPAARPLLQTLCLSASCTVGPWKRADVLDIEATALTQIGTRNAYKLALTLRNKSSTEVATPWIELTVTDPSGAVVARRVLPPTALTPSLERLGPDSDQAFSLSFNTGSARVSGYTVSVFHP